MGPGKRIDESNLTYQNLVKALEEYGVALKEARTLNTEEHLKIVDEKFNNVISSFEAYFALQGRSVKKTRDSVSHVFLVSTAVFTFLIILAAFTFRSLGIAVKETIIPPMKRMAKNFKSIAEGDITKRFDITTQDEIGEMGRYFNSAMNRLHETITHFAKSCIVLSTTANTLDTSSRQMMTGVDEIVSQVSPVADATEEMSMTTSDIAQNCVSAEASSEQANAAAVSGESIVGQTIGAMNQINGFVKEAAEIIERLGNRSDEIGGAINIIKNIAAQTNILALNATIEAVRAGEYGKGFTIVADEVKKLASQTTQATEHIGDIIEAIKSETDQAVNSMVEGTKIVEAGVKEATRSGSALNDILQQISIVTTQISQIADASEGQSFRTDEIAKSIQQISDIMKETTIIVGGNAESATRMAELSNKLKKLVGQFVLASPEQARAMVNRAYSYIQEKGKEKALAEFNNPSGEFVKGELFIFAQDFRGNMLAYGGNPELAGKNLYDATDEKGKYLGRDMIRIAKTKGYGWYDYHYMNPFTETIREKTTYVKAIDGYFIACGVYKKMKHLPNSLNSNIV
jgi:methyl-accepting chemotaxis protein